MFLTALFVPVTVAVYSGPVDTSVLRGNTATLQCSNDAFEGGITQWSEGDLTFASETGVFPRDAFAKYQDFEINSTSSTQIDLVIPYSKVADEGTYTCEISPDSGTATFKVESKCLSCRSILFLDSEEILFIF